ncbi:MAG TPA: amino acid adenylation domain-containing protein [Candidatus Polarisedimenticolia bacterium]|nr:amino acid adenylation domain-containing protein [Candidatus Polarisedimenticolia bacterium]
MAGRSIGHAAAGGSGPAGPSRITLALDEPETSALIGRCAASGSPVEHALLAALALAWSRWSSCGELLVEIEGHGRDTLEGFDLSRTVGWFTCAWPVLLEGIAPSDPRSALAAVHRALAGPRGHGFQALRRYAADPAARAILERVPAPGISFNYLGRFDSGREPGGLFHSLREPASAARSPRDLAAQGIEIDAVVVDGRLAVHWSFSGGFEAPAMSRLAAGMREAIGALGLTPGAEPASAQRGRKGPDPVFPLTPMQEGMLFHHLREEQGADPYVGQIALEVTAGVDAGRMARAWQKAVDALPALRTDFAWEGLDHPVQIVRSGAELPAAIHPGGTSLDAVMARARGRGFDVGRAPLARVDMVPAGEGRLTVVFTHHHLLLDGWSLPFVLETVFEAYEGSSAGGPAPGRGAHPALERYVAWLAGQDHAAAEAFFRRQLAGFSAPTPLPGPARSRRGLPAASAGTLHAAAPEGVERRARALGITPATVVQAAWALVLASSSGQQDVLFGATSSGRPPEIEGMEEAVGLFINTLPVRVRIDSARAALEWIREIQTGAAALRQHEHARLAAVQRCAGVPAGTPLFETLLVFENYPIDVAALGRRESFAVRSVRLHEETNYPLTLVASSEAGLRFRALYDRSRYTVRGLSLVLDRLSHAIEQLLSRPSDPLGRLDLIPEPERALITAAFNDTRRDYPRDASVPEAFLAAAREHPGRTALVHEAGSCTYGQLAAKGEALAQALAARGVRTESRVALAMDRGPAFVEAVLGVMMAGGAYVPIDPDAPPARARRMLEASGAALMVTSGGGSRGIEAPCPVVRFDELARRSEQAPRTSLPRAGPANLAYVMFTSGSTGEPKGTEVTHRGVLRLVLGADYVRFGPGETTLLLSSLAFDVSSFEIWAALLHGGRLAIAPAGASTASEIARCLERFEVTTLWLTSGLFQLVADEEVEALARVSQVLAGGDIVSPAHVRRLIEAGCPLFVDGYGPTEAATFASTEAVRPGDEVPDRLPIGRPIANTTLHVLGPRGELLPLGAQGELCIGGDGVARGYAGQPDRTAERFVPDPFGPPGSRLYRTGDVAAWREDGRLDFFGRRDRQVKVRGFRVETDDVEGALASLPGVRAAAVVARRETGSVELIGYVVPAGAGARDPARLRAALAERVPKYMVPSRLVILDALPVNASGKIDRASLPPPGIEEAPASSAAPLTPAEEEVARVWREVLGVASIGPDDDFFAAGGHSLHATRVAARLRRSHGVDLPLRALFEAPTPRLLALRLAGTGRRETPPILPAPAGERRTASFAQRRLWFLDRLEPGGASYTIAAAVRMQGGLDPAALGRALSLVVERHEALRTVFEEGPDGPLAAVRPPSPVPLPLDDLSPLPAADREKELSRRIGSAAREPFDLSRGPLLRARLLRLASGEHVLALAVHHIAADGWSLGVMVDELAASYAALVRGREPELPPLRVQYADWAAWQRRILDEGGEGERQLAYWRGALEGLPPLVLPADRPRPARSTGAGGSLPVRLDAGLTARLEGAARAQGATLHMALTAAFAAVLGRWSGQEDFGIGTPVANRTGEETEHLIGCFVNTLVLRMRLHGSALSFRELLSRVRDQALAAHAHQDVPFERVVEAVQPARDLSRTPLFQVMLVLQNAPAGTRDLGGIRLTPREAPTGTSTFDLTLSLEPGDGLEGAIEYSTELFDEATVERLWRHVTRMIEAAAADPDGDVRGARLLSDSEREAALERWSGRAAVASVAAEPVHRQFERQAALHPGRRAVVLEGRAVTYRELDGRSSRLAALLRDRGVRPEDRVGICLERSPELAVAMIAVWKAGAAFVPLDPDHPPGRTRAALRDAGAALVLAARSTKGIAGGDGRTVVLVDDPDAGLPPPAPAAPARGRSLAYVIYTSGTTGTPKGVMVEHGSLAAACEAWKSLYELDQIRVHLQMAGPAFDVCTGDVVRALCTGGTLVIASRERLLDPLRLLDLGRSERAEFAEFVPAVLRGLAACARDGAEPLSSIRIAAVGSDVWTTAEIASFRKVLGPGARLANSYGVTEATIDSTCWFAGEGDEPPASPPIGRPLGHAVVHVLDGLLEPVPPGVIGDLYLGGPGVARGYAGRPGQTAARFVPDPFGPPGARLYRTGDRARWLAGGRLVFAGRGDDQVKVRGVRIEPAEVEAAVAALPAVAACAVIARPDPAGGSRLAAFVVPAAGAPFDPAAARAALGRSLPEMMIPAAFAVLDALPLTANGKVDRRRLPEPAWAMSRDHEPPGTPAEQAVAQAFAEVLGRERVGAGDDFFALGGHSLLATQVISRLRAARGVELPLRDLFEAPTVRGLAGRLEGLAGAAAPPPVPRASAGERRLLSWAQRRLWFLDRLDPGTALYNLPSSIVLEGDLDEEALQRALSEVVARHEALRTRFAEQEGVPVQIVDPPFEVPLPLDDLSGLPEDARRGEAERIARAEAVRPFDLQRGPLLRARLLRLAPRRHSLLVTLHHICADGWSLVVLVRELGAFYGRSAGGGRAAPPPLAVQYADWAAWQRAWIEEGEMERQLASWRDELAGAPPLALPADRPRPARPTWEGGSLEIRLEASVRAGLEKAAREEGATLYMALLAGFALSLARWSGQDDVTIGTPIANRRTAEAEPLIGFFVNTLAMRLRLGGPGTTFRDLLRRARDASLRAYACQDVPFERVVEELQPDRSLGHSPLVQVLFALQNVPVGEIELPGLTFRYEEPDSGLCRFDLELFLAESDEGLEGLLNFSAEMFDRETIERFVENWAWLLRCAAEDPGRPLDRLPAMAPPQSRRILLQWNAHREPYGDPPAVHALFERMAATRPEAPALRHGGRLLTYGELEARSNRLARLLRRRGIGSGGRAAICLQRSFGMIEALLAIIKAGAAYVPVDPEYPPERIALILDDARPRAVLAQEATARRLPGGTRETILLDRVAGDLDGEDPGPPGVATHPESLVYCVYTSGSTGRPKGVAMTHAAISNLLSWQRRDSEARGARRTLQFASLSFDVSFQEILSTLTAGGELVLVGEEERRDASLLLRLAAEAQIERLFLPFVALHQMAEAARHEPELPLSLREINTAGEQLRITPAIAALFGRLPGCRLVNHYGPSETHLVTTFTLEGDPGRWPELPPIGRPIRNAPVYLLDAAMRPVAIGAPGELYVGGAGLARGYHDRPGLTAASFVPDPFSGVEGARLYRTGDVARFRHDGQLEFLGRRDLQVKVRGHRVEPGEIEAALERLPAVARAAVRAHEHSGGRRLAGYVVLRPGRQETTAELRERLAASLPDWMVPSAILILDALPTSPNGKIDRQALPEPAWGELSPRAAPRTPEEEIVCGILAEILEVPSVGATGDFFEMGGHSLLATQVIARVRKAFGVEVPLRALFEAPTARGIAGAAAAARGSSLPVPPPLSRAEGEERARLSFAQQRLWFLQRLDPASAAYNLPAALALEGDLDAAALRRALQEVLRRHEALRTRYEETPGGPRQRIDPPAPVSLAAIDLSSGGAEAAEARTRELLREEAGRPFDLTLGPVLRAKLLRLSPRRHVLSLVAHHIAADGWSLGILARELAALYAAFAAGRPSPLPEPALQYADWAAWQRAWMASGEMERQLAWWREVLAGVPPALDLPADRARPAVATARGATLPVTVPAALADRLRRLARSEGATLHMALLAVYAWTLMRQAGCGEIVIGTPVANRRTAEAEGMIGFFVNTLAVRLRGGGDPSLRDMIARAREASLEAFGRQDLPFERLVEALQPERALNRAPLVQTAFALQSVRMPAAGPAGLRMTPLEVESKTAKFDLMLILSEEEGGIEGSLEYSTDLFERETIEGIAGRMLALLERAAADPDRPLAIAAAPSPEEDLALAGWGAAPAAPAAAEGLLHALIARQAAVSPRAPALARGAETIRYADMQEAVHRLAHHLAGLGVRPESRVAVAVERSPAAIVAILGTLHAGGAYVPIDPSDPPERIRWILSDSGASVLIAADDGAASLALEGMPVVDLLRDRDAIASRPASPPGAALLPAHLAYVIYTSGSTGRPKGVAVEHHAIVSYVQAAIHRLGIEPGWRFAVLSTLAADLGHTSLFTALATGGCLDLLPPGIVFDAPAVGQWLAAHPHDALKIVPSHLDALLAGAPGWAVLPRRLLVVGGEASPGDRLAAWTAARPGMRVAVHYGPTEATVGAAACFPGGVDAARAALPLGPPLPGRQARVVDGGGRLVPPGVPGELLLGGQGLARGYTGRPDLTAERFLPDPFSREPGARLYRTGDRARWLAGGRLEFLGRRDGQIKVRGVRVEPAEIEAALEAVPGVRRAVAALRGGGTAGPRLAAYVVAEPRVAPSVGGLRRRALGCGLAVAELNRNETDYIEREIFQLGAYLRHGISLRDGDTVLDVGANIGLFSLHASLACRAPRLVLFEPNPHLLPILKANAAAYVPSAEIVEAALADREGTAPFTFFPGFSLLSGLHADAGAEKQVVATFLQNQARAGMEGAAELAGAAGDLLDERFAGRSLPVRLRTLSAVLAERRIDRVGLLKINAEKAELEVLRGISGEHWKTIDQMVIEVDLAAHLDPILALLQGHRFDAHLDQDPLLERTALRYVYAVRRGSGRALRPGAPPPAVAVPPGEPLLTAQALRAAAARALPPAMQPSAYVFLESLPLTPNGKVDRARLPDPPDPGLSGAPPRGAMEQAVAALWSEALGPGVTIGAHDNFFDLGGHSLLLTRVHARLRETLGADLPVIELFRYPTVASLAARLAGDSGPHGAAEEGARRGARRREAARARAARGRAETA